MKPIVRAALAIVLAFLPGCSSPQTPTPTPQRGQPVAHDHHDHEHHDHGHEHHNHGHEGPGKVHFDSRKQRASGVETQAVGKQALAGELLASGSLDYDENLRARVTSRLSGRATKLLANLGDKVSQGQPLAWLDTPELVGLITEYHEAETTLRLAQQALQRRRKLAVYGREVRRPLEDARNEVATAQAELEVALSQEAVTGQNRQRVDQMLQEGIASQAQAEQQRALHQQSRAQLKLARRRLEIARSSLAREERVASLGLLANKEIQEAEADLERAGERVQHLREGILALGADPDSHASQVVVLSPISGIVTERTVTLGESVSGDKNLFTVVDVQRLWLWVAVVESQLAQLKTGLSVEVRVTAFAREAFPGRISYIAPELEPKSRSARALVVIENSRQLLKPGMFAEVRIRTDQTEQLVVPESALQRVDNVDVVYVLSQTDEFERRAVVVGLRGPDRVEVLEGLKAGEKVAIRNVHLLKAEDLKSQLEEGGHSH